MQGGQCRDRDVHRWKTIQWRIKLVDEGEEPFRPTTLLIQRAPIIGCLHRKKDEANHLQHQQHEKTDGDVEKIARGGHDEVDVNDNGIIEAAINPNPAGPVWNEIVDAELQLPRLVHRVALAPEVELINTDDQDRADDELNDDVFSVHKDSHGLMSKPAPTRLNVEACAPF